ncbi:MAG: hypothetical protein CAF43_000480 [Nitrospira sp. CG24C]|jgi:type I restriction enzyme S subunit|nr:MAG: hypothetical protein CAF43_000480 [Nitrospira sp. CG24C]
MSKWSLVPLGNILTERQEVPPDYALASGEIPIIAKIGFDDGRIQLRAEGQTKTGMILIRPGDFVVSGINAAKGAIAIYGEENTRSIAATIHYGAYIPQKERIDISFLWWLLRSRTFRGLLLEYVPGGVKTELKSKRLLPIPIPLPSLPEQQRIVARIETLSAKIEEARELRRHAAGEAEAHLGATSLALFSSLRPLSSVGEVCEVIDPNPSHRYPVYVPKGIPIISSSEFVGDDGIDPTRSRQVPEAFYEATLGRYKVCGGDVVFSRKGKVGYARLHPDAKRLAMTHTLCVMKPDRARIEPRYLLHFARSPFFLEELTGTMNPNVGVPTLGLGVIRDANIPLVHLSEQRRIVAYLDGLQAKVDELKKLQFETAAELAALLPSILDKAFKGEL